MRLRLFEFPTAPARALIVALAIVAGSAPLHAQLDRYLVFLPSTIQYGMTAGERHIAARGFTADGAMEASGGTPATLAPTGGREFAPLSWSDGSGGIYLLYTTESGAAGSTADRNLMMRRIGPAGDDLWLDSGRVGIPIAAGAQREQNPRVVTLEDGSMTIVYEVSYLAEGSEDIDLAAVRISPDGRMLWPQPVWVARTTWRERLAGAVANGGGGVVAIYQISTRKDTILYSDIKAARIDSSSALGWKDSRDPVVVAQSRHIESNPSVVSDRKGGAYISYEVEYTNGPRAGDVDILAQHLTAFGTREWTSESRLPFVSSIDKARERYPSIALDSGAIVVAFQIYYYGVKRPFYMIGVQRLDSTGQLVWNKGKKAETIDLPGRVVESPQVIADPNGGVFVLFESKDTVTSNRDVHAQKLDGGGVKIWGSQESGISVFGTPEIERDPAAIPDGSGGLVLVGVRERPNGDGTWTNEVVADRIAPDGSLPWKEILAPIVLMITADREDRPAVLKR